MSSIPLCTQAQLTETQICSERSPYPSKSRPYYLNPPCFGWWDANRDIRCDTPLNTICNVWNDDPNVSYTTCISGRNNNVITATQFGNSGGAVNCIQTKWNEDNFDGCCSGRINSTDQCSPQWCPVGGNTTCADRMINDPVAICREDVTDPDCVRYCSTVATGQTKVTCDNLFREYCQNNTDKEDPLCGCITPNYTVNSNSDFDRVGFCYSSTCNPTNPNVYQTNEITETLKTCTADQICSVAINCYNDSTCKIDRNKINQNCNVNLSDPSTGTNNGATNGGTTNGTTNGGSGNGTTGGLSNTIVYIIIAIVIVIIIIIIIVIIYFSS